MWFEVRLYEDGAFQAVTIKISPEKNVQDLKEAIAEAYQQDHFRATPVDKMKLLCNAQMRGDTELVAGFSVGDRGTREMPAIMQLYIRSDEDVYDMEVDEEEAVDAFPVIRQANTPHPCKLCGTRGHQLLFLAVGLSFLIMVGYGVSAVMSPHEDTGHCHSSFNSRKDSYCTYSSSNGWTPVTFHLVFSESEATPEPACFDCLFDPPQRIDAHSFVEATQNCSAQGSMLPVVSGFIPEKLCAALRQNHSSDLQAFYWVDMRRIGSTWTTSAGRVVKTTYAMWDNDEPKSANNYVALHTGTCRLVTVADEYALQGHSKIGTLCMKESRRDDLVDDATCDGRAVLSHSVISGGDGQCVDFCRDWCFANDQFRDQCCQAQKPTELICNCSLNEVAPSNTSVQRNDAAKLQISAIDPSLLLVQSQLFVQQQNMVLAGTGDVDTQNGDFTAESCAEQCALAEQCQVASLGPTQCSLYSREGASRSFPKPSTHGTLLDLYSEGATFCHLTGTQQFASEMACLQFLWSSLDNAAFVCTEESDGSCSIEKDSNWPTTSLGVIVTAGIVFFCSFAGLACKYSQRAPQESVR